MSSESNELLIEQLRKLEYSIRQSITVREDQEDDADSEHTREAEHLGVASEGLASKGDLLNAVQTALRATARDSGR